VDWSALPWGNLGAGGALLIVVMMVIRGALVPRSTLEDVRADRDARLEEKQREIDRLNEAVTAWQAAGVEQAGQVTKLLEVADTARHVLLSLPHGDRGDV
jgi:hypothetical protein